MPASVKISCDEFEQKARELGIHDMRSFYESLTGTTRLDGRNIIHTF